MTIVMDRSTTAERNGAEHTRENTPRRDDIAEPVKAMRWEGTGGCGGWETTTRKNNVCGRTMVNAIGKHLLLQRGGW